MKASVTDALGVAIDFIAEEHVFTYLLSSPFTTRTIAREKGQTDEVKKDLEISLILSAVIGVIIGWLLGSTITSISGVVIGILLYVVYAWRAELL